MTTRRLAAIALLAAVLMAATGTVPARAQASARLDLVAQTTFVGEDPAVIDVRVLGAPAGATMRAQLHEAVTTRAGLADSIAGRPPTPIIGQWPVPNVDEIRVGSGNVISLQVPDEEIGLLLRRTTDAGPHPLVIDLLDGDEVIDSLVTHLLVFPPETARRLTVALVLDLGVELSITPDGTSVLDERALDRAVGLADVLASRVELPVTVLLTPETFEALDRTGSDRSLALLRAAAVGNSVLMAPWVDIDAEAWRRAGRADTVETMFARGRDVLSSVALASPGSIAALDATSSPQTLTMLASDPIAATGFLLDGDFVISVPEGTAAPVVVTDGAGISHPAVLPDRFLSQLVTGSDPELAVHDTLAELLRMALNSADQPAGVVIAPEEVDLFALDLLLESLDRASPLVPGSIETVLAIPVAEHAAGRPVEARLTPDPPEDLSQHLPSRRELEARLAASASMVAGDDDHTGTLRTIMLASAARAAANSRPAYLATVEQQVDAALSGVELIDTGRVTITSRRADLPILIRNDQPNPINVALTLSAEKIDFPGGDRQLMVLQPGDNEIALEVVALASGDSVINLAVVSPEGGVELATDVVRLRSTALSGLGLLISVVALLVLLSWWIRTGRSRRRSNREAPDSVAATPEEPGYEHGDGQERVEDRETAEGET